MFKITQDNYKDYKKVFEIIWHVINEVRSARRNLLPEHSPIAVLSNWEKESMSLAKRGLQEGLRDSLTMLTAIGSPPAFINEINNQLTAQNLPTLNKLIATIKDIPGNLSGLY
jgi:hypothetical protein